MLRKLLPWMLIGAWLAVKLLLEALASVAPPGAFDASWVQLVVTAVDALLLCAGLVIAAFRVAAGSRALRDVAAAVVGVLAFFGYIGVVIFAGTASLESVVALAPNAAELDQVHNVLDKPTHDPRTVARAAALVYCETGVRAALTDEAGKTVAYHPDAAAIRARQESREAHEQWNKLLPFTTSLGARLRRIAIIYLAALALSLIAGILLRLRRPRPAAM